MKHVKLSENTTHVGGNLTRAAKKFTSESGNTYVLFTVAVNRPQGEGTDYVDCIAFGKQAEAMEKYTGQGSAVLLSGRLSTRLIEEDGKKRNSMRVVAERVQFLDPIETGATNGLAEAVA